MEVSRERSSAASRPTSTIRRAQARLIAVLAALGLIQPSGSDAAPNAAQIGGYFEPFAATNNLSGSILVLRDGSPWFARSYGYSDLERHIPNSRETRFHIASLSILYTSTAALRLIDQGKLSFDTRVSDIVPGIANGHKITVRNLLLQNSGMADSNDDLPNYDDLLKAHQTPQSLIDAIRALPPAGEPGGKSQREEHSGQNLLALIIERKTGMPFAQAMKLLVFDPFGMHDSGIDDDGPIDGPVAHGYQHDGTFGLKPAPAFHWSAKTGNGSAYSTVSDEWEWLQGILRGPLLSASSRSGFLGPGEGFGWERVDSQRLGEPVYVAGGRAPGFSSFLEYLPNEELVIIDFTNIENAANPLIVQDAVAMLRGKPFQAFGSPVSFAVSGRPRGDFVFGPEFYRRNATLSLVSDANGVTLNWPGGPAAPLIPVGKDKFKDRYYWIDVTVVRDPDGNPIELDYGKFRGMRQNIPAHG